MPIETAAQSPVLHSQIRPPDRAALQLDPTHYNGWGRAETVRDQQLWQSSTILPSSHRPCCHTTPGKSVLISPKTWAISQSAHYYWIMHRFFFFKRYCIIDHNSHPVWMKIIELTDQPKQFKWVSLLTFFRSRIYLTTLYGKMILELCFYV